jgi:AraC-like DNA-binding protein
MGFLSKHQESQRRVCSSIDRLSIERKYLDGYSERALAQLYGMSDSTVHRHVVGTDLTGCLLGWFDPCESNLLLSSKLDCVHLKKAPLLIAQGCLLILR